VVSAKMLALVSKLFLTLALYICSCHFYSLTFDISPDLGLEQLALALNLASFFWP